MYLEREDYYSLISREDLEAALLQSEAQLERIERMACDEVSSYLRRKYRIASEFARTGDDRNDNLVRITLDVALYHLFTALPGRITDEDVRRIRYLDAIKWLVSVRDSDNDPGIPSLSDPNPDGTDPEQNPEMFQSVRWGSMPRNENTY
ncbi:MAG: DUF1320 family protein [Rikenellaceae bacterium]|nr:DUF1320 family protein [Rikenellaceae bacterium]